MNKHGKQFFSMVMCLTFLISMLLTQPVAASRMAAIPGIPSDTYLPVNDTYTQTPTFSWKAVSGATYYRISVYRRSDSLNILRNLDLQASVYCKNMYCKFTPTTFINPLVNNTNYKWKLAAGNSEGISAFTSFIFFSVKPGINSTFTSNATGWQPIFGNWTITADGFYKATANANGLWVSSSYTGSYADFSMEAKVYKAGITSTSYGIIYRGDPSVLNPVKMWNYGYAFLINDFGNFGVIKYTPGGAVMLISWTEFDGLDPNSSNTLKVSVTGSKHKFFINGYYVGGFQDGEYFSGKVGVIGAFNDVSIRTDYVKLGQPLPPFTFATETVGRPANCPPDPMGCIPVR